MYEISLSVGGYTSNGGYTSYDKINFNIKVMYAWKFSHLVLGLQWGNISKVMITNGGREPCINDEVQKGYHTSIDFHSSNWAIHHIWPCMKLGYLSNWATHEMYSLAYKWTDIYIKLDPCINLDPWLKWTFTLGPCINWVNGCKKGYRISIRPHINLTLLRPCLNFI